MLSAQDYLFENYPAMLDLFKFRMESLPSIPLFDSEMDDTIFAIASCVVHDVLSFSSVPIATDERYILIQEFAVILIQHYNQSLTV